jgi:hypothetical protein
MNAMICMRTLPEEGFFDLNQMDHKPINQLLLLHLGAQGFHKESPTDFVPSRALELSPNLSCYSGLFFNSSLPGCSWSAFLLLPLGIPVQGFSFYCALIFT